jgi:hypothetical protein
VVDDEPDRAYPDSGREWGYARRLLILTLARPGLPLHALGSEPVYAGTLVTREAEVAESVYLAIALAALPPRPGTYHRARASGR